MTSSELMATLAVQFSNLMVPDAEISVKVTLDAIVKALAQGDRVEIRGFGSFELKYRPPRQARNPKSGETVSVAAKYLPHFKAGKELRERIVESVKEKPLKQVA